MEHLKQISQISTSKFTFSFSYKNPPNSQYFYNFLQSTLKTLKISQILLQTTQSTLKQSANPHQASQKESKQITVTFCSSFFSLSL